MSRAKLFISNMVVYGLGSILAKAVPFLMLPIVTRLMPGTAYYGLSDMSNTIVSFAQAFAIMGMYDAMFRMFFEREDNLDFKRRVCTTALLFVTGSTLVVAICLLLLTDPISCVFFGSSEYSILVVISAASVFIGGNNSIVQAPTRMQNRRVTFIVMNLVTALLSYAISIPLLLLGEYLVALPIAAVLTSLTSLTVFFILNRRWFSPRLFDSGMLRSMLVIGVPLMPTFIFYWVLNSADRLIVVNLIGIEAAGIFAVAAKIGQISQLIYTAFAQGWQYFAFSTMHDDDQVELNSRVYEYLGAISFLAAGLLIVFVNPLFEVMFPGDYIGGVVCAPYLFLAPLLLMLYQVAVNQLLVVKKTWPSLFMLGAGVIANLLLCFYFVPLIGIEGAAISTLAGYLVTNIVALVVLTRMRLMKVGSRFFCCSIFFTLFFCLWRFVFLGNTIMLAMMWLIFAIAVCVFYRAELIQLFKRVKSKLMHE